MSRVKFNLILELGQCHGEYMKIEPIDDVEYRYEFADDKMIVDFVIDWPTTVKLKVFGKDLKRDTVIDSNGNILANKYIRMISASLAGLQFTERVLYQATKFIPAGQDPINEIFWDRDGTVEFDFNSTSPMAWNLEKNNILYFR